jgi:hypothetical protein
MSTQAAWVITVGIICATIVVCHVLGTDTSTTWSRLHTNRLLERILLAIQRIEESE